MLKKFLDNKAQILSKAEMQTIAGGARCNPDLLITCVVQSDCQRGANCLYDHNDIGYCLC
ncbi:hypothetical protein [Neptunitalea lumnitzerae]|uniref:Uncharacterized protein n=1 Tax=Neptunitalea lumnitzerae TaxID=2965509 RepID=A0ABQ5MGU3_9FLAO|nr:hypothetical protein [Neptunitalea sp. Y10]GLB48609.1 hypothetical protein Y10_09770 [Neptunitalea sp. Y10]